MTTRTVAEILAELTAKHTLLINEIQSVVATQEEIAVLHKELAAVAITAGNTDEAVLALDILVPPPPRKGPIQDDAEPYLADVAKQGSLVSDFDESDDDKRSRLDDDEEYVAAALAVEAAPPVERPKECAECPHTTCEAKNQRYRHAQLDALQLGACCPLPIMVELNPMTPKHDDECALVNTNQRTSLRKRKVEKAWMSEDPRLCALCGHDGAWHAQGNNNISACRGYSPPEPVEP